MDIIISGLNDTFAYFGHKIHPIFFHSFMHHDTLV